MSKHPVFLLIRLVRSQNSKVLREKAKKQTTRELSRKTPDSMLCVPTERHLGCSEAWKPIEDCLDPISFESVDFQRLSQIIANLTRENLAEREAEITNLPWTLL